MEPRHGAEVRSRRDGDDAGKRSVRDHSEKPLPYYGVEDDDDDKNHFARGRALKEVRREEQGGRGEAPEFRGRDRKDEAPPTSPLPSAEREVASSDEDAQQPELVKGRDAEGKSRRVKDGKSIELRENEDEETKRRSHRELEKKGKKRSSRTEDKEDVSDGSKSSEDGRKERRKRKKREKHGRNCRASDHDTSSEDGSRDDSDGGDSKSSGDSSQDRKKRKRKRKHRKHRSAGGRSISEGEDNSSGSDDRRKKKRKRKEEKRRRKEEKKKAKEEEKRRKKMLKEAQRFLKEHGVRQKEDAPQTPRGMPPGTPSISEDDYFSKNPEFSTWLREDRKTFFASLSAEEARGLFPAFVDAWNSGKLRTKLYEGVSGVGAPRSSHNWNIKGNERDMDPADVEDERVARKAQEKLERKRTRKEREELLDELIPTATGREAMIEKRKLRREEARAREDSPEMMREKDIMGGGEDYQSRLTKDKEWRERKKSRKVSQFQEKQSAYNEKEAEKMDQLRALVAMAGGKITIAKRDQL